MLFLGWLLVTAWAVQEVVNSTDDTNDTTELDEALAVIVGDSDGGDGVRHDMKDIGHAEIDADAVAGKDEAKGVEEGNAPAVLWVGIG